MSGFAIQASTMEDMPQPSFQPRFSIMNAITTALTQIERARGFLEAATLSEQWVRAMGGKGGGVDGRVFSGSRLARRESRDRTG